MAGTWDSILRIAAFNAGRHPALLALKYRKMAATPFAYFRGTNHLFHREWPRERWLDRQPLAWLNGDLHVENFGTYRGENRLVYFDIGDFDEGCLGPPSRDLMRFLVGLHLIAGSDRPKVARELSGLFLDRYRQAIVAGKARWIERRTAKGLIGRLLRELENRTQSDLLARRTVGKGRHRRLRLDNGKALAVEPEAALRVRGFMERFADGRAKPGFFKVLDVAQRVAGLGALGLPRYVVLVKGTGGPDGAALIDFKPQQGSALAASLDIKQPHFGNEAQRVVDIETRMQVVGPAFLTPARIGRQLFTMRELQPSADKLDITAIDPGGAQFLQTIAAMGELTASAQLRASGLLGAANADSLIEFGRERAWVAPMRSLASRWARRIETDWRQFRESKLYDWARSFASFNGA